MTADERGALIPVSIVARWLGPHRKTIQRWVETGIIKGREIAGRWYVYRDEALRLRDGTDVTMTRDAASLLTRSRDASTTSRAARARERRSVAPRAHGTTRRGKRRAT